jgi:ribosomal protein L13E
LSKSSKKETKTVERSVEDAAPPAEVHSLATIHFKAAPIAMVTARHEGGEILREARGFSAGELAAIHLTSREAVAHRLMVDFRRRSVSEQNVSLLKEWESSAKKPKKPAKMKPAPEAKQAAPKKVEKKEPPKKEVPAKKAEKPKKEEKAKKAAPKPKAKAERKEAPEKKEAVEKKRASKTKKT